jgi:hypothetical protein
MTPLTVLNKLTAILGSEATAFRFIRKIELPKRGGCWLWTGAKSNGYGCLFRRKNGQGQTFWAHVVSYTAHKRLLAPGLELDHLCKVKHCINPDHLEAVTHRENVRRGRGVVAEQMARTHCAKGHELVLKWGQRRCLECRRAKHRVNDAKRRTKKRLIALGEAGKLQVPK